MFQLDRVPVFDLDSPNKVRAALYIAARFAKLLAFEAIAKMLCQHVDCLKTPTLPLRKPFTTDYLPLDGCCIYHG